ncbi:MAG: DeoR/GlpR family DNA-binding transcription regulator [Opitutaceae bacterium]
MNPYSMLIAERHRAIVRLLSENSRITLADIEVRFGVSSATARRDASVLAAAGLVKRSHGGLLPADYPGLEPSFKAKASRQASTKARLARTAAELLPQQGTVFVDAGTTCLEVGRLLIQRRDLRIYTNSITLIALADESMASLTCIGGEVRKVSLALTGALAQVWMERLRFDAVVLSASGLDVNDGLFTTEIHEAAIKTEILRRSSYRLLVADSDKWSHTATVHFAPWNALSAVVTNRKLQPDECRKLQAAGVAIHSP